MSIRAIRGIEPVCSSMTSTNSAPVMAAGMAEATSSQAIRLIGMRGSYGGVLMFGLLTGLMGLALVTPLSVGAGVILGKVLGVAGQLLALQAVLLVGVAVLYGTHIDGALLLAAACLAATAGLASAGCLYAALAAGLRVRDTLLPLLLLPVLAPVLIAATRAFDDALGTVGVDGWAWVNLLIVFAAVYLGLALALAPALLEES